MTLTDYLPGWREKPPTPVEIVQVMAECNTPLTTDGKTITAAGMLSEVSALIDANHAAIVTILTTEKEANADQSRPVPKVSNRPQK